MKVLNLSTGFHPLLGTTYNEIQYQSFTFSGGEVHIKLHDHSEEVLITTRLNTSDDIMKLLLAADALRRSGTKKISAFIPYLPYARQDRVMVPGEPLSVKIMCDLLNSCRFEKIYIYDVHSDVPAALLMNAEVITNTGLVNAVLKDKNNYLLVSPDAGALKKIYKTAAQINYQGDIVTCNKVRDVSSGNIKAIRVDTDDLQGRDCYIVDDICDGGATFTGIAKELKQRNAGKIFLIVSHGIFSNGESVLGEWFDHIYTTDSIRDVSSALISRLSLLNIINL